MDKSRLLRILMKKYRGATFALNAALSKPKAFPAPVFGRARGDCLSKGRVNKAFISFAPCPSPQSLRDFPHVVPPCRGTYGCFFKDPIVNWSRTILSDVPSTKVREIAAMLKPIHVGEDIAAAQQKKAVRLIEKAARSAADHSRRAGERRCCAFPEQHWRRIRTTDEMDKQFFMNGTMFVDRGHSFVAVPRAILPSCPPTLQPRRLGVGQGWPLCGPPWSALGAATYAVAAA
jgi:hypothetical protein